MTDRFLPTALRRALEKAVKAARDVAEEGAADAVRRLGVADATPPAHLSDDAKALRRRLRAHARTLGDMVIAEGVHEVRHLVEATGYAQWHRRLFARFLAERGLLRHPEHGPVTLEDCEELAELEGFADAWAAAESYGARMLPGVFLPDDPVLALEFAPEHAQALRHLVDGLNPAIFQADDSLGWTYQFWRASEKARVNAAGGKIGAAGLPAVTQLFTEPYMVRFLLHNTLGAWHAGKVLARRPELAVEATDEDALRAAVALPGYDFDMLRFVKDGEAEPSWRPGAGVYPGWPTDAAKLTVLDPCCGSGHFLTEALTILAALRAEEDGLAPAEAVAAVLKENLFGLEIDSRCVQIAAFAVALIAWKIGGWQTLPAPHIAWVGAPPPLSRATFTALGGGVPDLEYALGALHDQFAQAPILGSLLEPTGVDLFESSKMRRVEGLLEQLVAATRTAEPESAEGTIAARGMADAASNLNRRFTLIATNVPYLGIAKHETVLSDYIAARYPTAKLDLATAFIERISRWLDPHGAAATVSLGEWLYLGPYTDYRRSFLKHHNPKLIARLGWNAFSYPVRASPALVIEVASPPIGEHLSIIDATAMRDISGNQGRLRSGLVDSTSSNHLLKNPDARFIVSTDARGSLLADFAESRSGLHAGDMCQFFLNFWEVGTLGSTWEPVQTAVNKTELFAGRNKIIRWENEQGSLYKLAESVKHLNHAAQNWRAGKPLWGKNGIIVGLMGNVACALYTGEIFDSNSSAIVAKDENDLPAIWCFCESGEFSRLVRKIDNALKIAPKTLLKIPFDADHWRRVAKRDYPSGLPRPISDDPTQWTFHGDPRKTVDGIGLHVALARLAGYRWPAENDPNMRLSAEARVWIEKSGTLPNADKDSLLCLEAVAGEQSLAQRLRTYLAAAFGDAWSDALERKLVTEADQALDKKVARDGSLEAWLRDRAFRQHCRLFHDRPFLWQVWDGSPDGFSAFVHYHRLDTATLSKLTYTVLGDWIARMSNGGDARRVEAAKILQQKLTTILGGEAPLDVFVRWKPLKHQPVGWDPDIDDGVRLNIRPFVKAGVLREMLKIKWGVDRGSDVASAPWFLHDKGKRNNDRHLTLAEKQAARGAK
jgi:hypothetical protein